jgi:hypothetical protein
MKCRKSLRKLDLKKRSLVVTGPTGAKTFEITAIVKFARNARYEEEVAKVWETVCTIVLGFGDVVTVLNTVSRITSRCCQRLQQRDVGDFRWGGERERERWVERGREIE